MISPEFQNRSILLVDDYAPVREVALCMLGSLGFTNIYGVSNGLEAVQILETKAIDVVISDWKMPKMDGLQLLKYVRSKESTRNIGFIMVSGEVSEAAMMEAVDARANSYMFKPFTVEALTEKVREALS